MGTFTPGHKKVGGRAPGTPNKATVNTLNLKEIILESLNRVSGGDGGISYLMSCAATHKREYLNLVGRVLPLQVTGNNGAPISVSITTYTEPADADDQPPAMTDQNGKIIEQIEDNSPP